MLSNLTYDLAEIAENRIELKKLDKYSMLLKYGTVCELSDSGFIFYPNRDFIEEFQERFGKGLIPPRLNKYNRALINEIKRLTN